MRVCIYKNLNNGKWSITEVTGNKGKGKVIGYANHTVVLRDCITVVQASGQAKVAAGGHKQVHAWIVGELISQDVDTPSLPVAITYNPKVNKTFTRRADNSAIDNFKQCVLNINTGVTVKE